jgi:hypothetical protein
LQLIGTRIKTKTLGWNAHMAIEVALRDKQTAADQKQFVSPDPVVVPLLEQLNPPRSAPVLPAGEPVQEDSVQFLLMQAQNIWDEEKQEVKTPVAELPQPAALLKFCRTLGGWLGRVRGLP